MRFNNIVDLDKIDVWINFAPHELSVTSTDVIKGLLALVEFVGDSEIKEETVSKSVFGDIDLEILRSLKSKLKKEYDILSTMQEFIRATEKDVAEHFGWSKYDIAICNYGNARTTFVLTVSEVIMLQRILAYVEFNRMEFNQERFWYNSTEFMVKHIQEVIGKRLLVAMGGMKVGK